MRLVRWIISGLLLVAGAIVSYLIFLESPVAGAMTGMLMLTICLSLALGRRSPARPAASTGAAVAYRQARAMVRREEGEVTGAPAGS